MLENLPDAVGHALHDQRAGLDALAFHSVGLRAGLGTIAVTSLAFADHAPLPTRYTADGEGVSPPLQWSGLPPDTATVVLIVEDADSPTPRPLVHAIVVERDPAQTSLPEGAIDADAADGAQSVGRNSLLATGWLPPDPPPGHGVHRYAFQVFALGPGVALSESPGRDEVLDALREAALAGGMRIGTYERPDGSVKDDAAEAASGAPFAVPLAGA